MTTITIKINERTKAGKTLKNLIELFSKENKGVEIVEEKSPYNPEFVAKILEADKRGKFVEVNPKDIWGSLGLK
ncbi:hypothetical protein LUD75_08650 [Epilithonimonas sp. JDS]|uniref:DUF2683 family protein n=1 Tax=Epilithonimonas sp. JDS TaxID=2902797 RepID=UPI001E461116|nr:DUF2683 family protein [Epilithonimonas sp. JDS]MCD9854772.1 hypothetical protein [Epilithonimonas sp. JDS]